jgi:hypothetical protein
LKSLLQGGGKLSDAQEIEIRGASKEDFCEISTLYTKVYEGYYPIPETTDVKLFRQAVENHFWLVALKDGKIIASLILAGDGENGICKCYGAVVEKEFQSRKIMLELHKHAEEMTDYPVYYAISRTNSLAPQRILKQLGFAGAGIFPNAMRIKSLETQGLFVSYKKDALKARKKPILITPTSKLYKLVKNALNLGEASFVSKRIKKNGNFLDFCVTSVSGIKWEYKNYKEENLLQCDFFPFYEPNLKLYTEDRSTEVFIHYNPKAGYVYLLGVKSDNNLLSVLEGVADFALSLECFYIEMVIPADNIELQAAAYNADFLPCAYFPAFKKEGDKRVDQIVSSRLLVPPSFKRVHLEDMNREFVKAYCDVYTKKMRKDIYAWLYR